MKKTDSISNRNKKQILRAARQKSGFFCLTIMNKHEFYVIIINCVEIEANTQACAQIWNVSFGAELDIAGPVYTGPDKFLHGQTLARFHLAFTQDWRNGTNF